jgi:4-amino-4-deoxy-L-arabinose transferase-like glycosyltransferase
MRHGASLPRVPADKPAQANARLLRLRPLSASLSPMAAEALPLAAILTAAGLLFARGLRAGPTYDEAVYLAQTDALAHGQRLGTAVFAAQPPGFDWLLLAVSRIEGLGVDQLRLAIMAFALLGVLAVYVLGRAVAGPIAGLLAAALLAIAPSYPTFAANVSADLPGTVLAMLSLACFLVPTRRRRLWLIAAGLLFATAESVKLDAFVLLLPVPLYWATRRPRLAEIGIATAAAGAAFLAGAAVLGSELPGVWRSAVGYHLAARHVAGAPSNVRALESFFHPHQPFTWLTLVAAITALAIRPHTKLPLWPLWAMAAASLLFLLWQKPLHSNHLVLLAVALAVPAGASLAAVAAHVGRLHAFAVGALALVLAAAYAQDTYHAWTQVPVMPGLTWAAERVEAAVPSGQFVVSDEPIVAFLAHRRMPGETIDTALLRFDTGYLTDSEVLHAIAKYHVPVVVVGRSFYTRPRILAVLAKQFPRHVTFDTITVYYRSRSSG